MSFLNRFNNLNARELPLDWHELTTLEQLDDIVEASKSQTVAVFKHSTTCGISHHIKTNLEEDWDFSTGDVKFYYLDLLAYRSISNEIANRFGVVHQSPQVVVLRNGEAVDNWSHYGISANKLRTVIA